MSGGSHLALAGGLCIGLAAAIGQAQTSAKLLWEIGRADNDDREFALAPGQYNQFREDGFFAVGVSDPKRDWPYVHPGPADGWAGGRQHTFTVVFGTKQLAEEGKCRLVVDLVDTHSQAPPQLLVVVNGAQFQHSTPKGAGDDSVFGQPQKGREHRFEMVFPLSLLKTGSGNEIAITTVAGSWVLYDWIGLEAPAGTEAVPATQGTWIHNLRAFPALVEKQGRLFQPVQMTVRHFAPVTEGVVQIDGSDAVKFSLGAGTQTVEALIHAVEREHTARVELKSRTNVLWTGEVALKPVRKYEVYLLPHSHVDIGYTHRQADVERAQWQYIEQAMAGLRKTESYPAGAQFRWNVEVLWAVDSYLQQASEAKRQAFLAAVKAGWIGLDALYGNELTALCRPEELVRLVSYAARLAEQCGVAIDSAMISDVPGYTWGLMSVFGEAGVRYFSIGPNGGDRIGFTLAAWADKPFYWISPGGQHRVLCWIPDKGYFNSFDQGALLERLEELSRKAYPYELVQMRYCLGDNAGPGLHLCDTVKAWNLKYAYPRLVIATTAQLMREFERRHGPQLPQVRGDFTPYWEDGAASSARETALNREAAERLLQAETLWAIRNPRGYPAREFERAWRDVVLYDEHTWGAHNSISEPDAPFVKDQWAVKQAFALQASRRSQQLLAGALAAGSGAGGKAEFFEVWNTCAWPRTDLAVVPKELALDFDFVQDAQGQAQSSQRLPSGELVFVAKEVPALCSQRYQLMKGRRDFSGEAHASGVGVVNARLAVRVDPRTGAIASLRSQELAAELVNTNAAVALNDYLYVRGKDPQDAQRPVSVKVSVKETGPVVASLLIESEAPGCRQLTREVRLVGGLNRVDIINVIDKKAVRAKEGVHFGFGFNVPEGVVRMDIPWAVARPEADQMPGACKNWFTVQRWVDISNRDYGVTWATVDAPLVEVGAITAELPWMEHIEPSPTLYSYVMNNYWHTNYRAEQEGPTTFRYSLQPHRSYSPELAARFGAEASQPLLVAPAGASPVTQPRLRVEPAEAMVAAFKPSDDGRAWIVRLFNASDAPVTTKVHWGELQPQAVWLSGVNEKPRHQVTGGVHLPAYGLVTLRADLP